MSIEGIGGSRFKQALLFTEPLCTQAPVKMTSFNNCLFFPPSPPPHKRTVTNSPALVKRYNSSLCQRGLPIDRCVPKELFMAIDRCLLNASFFVHCFPHHQQQEKGYVYISKVHWYLYIFVPRFCTDKKNVFIYIIIYDLLIFNKVVNLSSAPLCCYYSCF